MTMQLECEFCAELSGSPSRFSEVYGPHTNREVARFGNLSALPTIGQLFKGSLLLVPRSHVESFAQVIDDFEEDLMIALTQLTAKLRVFGNVICFEHGATRHAQAGCGIYHAHFHLVPVPQPASVSLFTSHYDFFAPDLISGLRQLKDSLNYFIVRDSDGTVACLDESSRQSILTSQFARRALAQHYKLGNCWDWRQYTRPEKWLLETVQLLGEFDVSVCCRD